MPIKIEKQNKLKNQPQLQWNTPVNTRATRTENEKINNALHVWKQYDSGFNLSITDVSKILLCERSWVEKNVRDQVSHIRLGRHFREYMASVRAPGAEIVFLPDYYYFDRNDFKRWLHENTKAEMQTIRVDLSRFAKKEDMLLSAMTEYKMKANSKKRQLAGVDVLAALDETGRKLFDNQAVPHSRTEPFLPVSTTIPTEFSSAKSLREKYTSREALAREVHRLGAIKYTIAESLVRYDRSLKPLRTEEIAISYEWYLKLQSAGVFSSESKESTDS